MLNLYIFSFLAEDEIIQSLLNFKESHNEDDYFTAARGIINFSKERITDSNILKEYVLRRMLEQPSLPDITKLRNFLRHDIKLIYNDILAYDWNSLFVRCGFLPFSDIATEKKTCDIPGFALSLEAMIQCESNEALGGALLAHYESFDMTKTQL